MSNIRIRHVDRQQPEFSTIGAWVRSQPGHEAYCFAPDSSIMVVESDGKPLAVLELCMVRLLNMVFATDNNPVETLRAFEAARVGMDTAGLVPVVPVGVESPLREAAENRMTRIWADHRFYKM